MKQYRFVLLAAAAVTAFNLTLASALAANQEHTAQSAQPAAPVSASSEYSGYLLLDVDGKVCVYQSGDLLLETDIDVSLLPAADRLDLASGIQAETAGALAAYLEDFGA